MGLEMCIRDRVSRGGGARGGRGDDGIRHHHHRVRLPGCGLVDENIAGCLLYTSDAADERSSVALGGRRIIKQTNQGEAVGDHTH